MPLTEAQVSRTIGLQKEIKKEYDLLVSEIKDESFAGYDGLNKDLFITEANMLQAAIGILSIRVGLNISALKSQPSDNDKVDDKAPDGSEGQAAAGTEEAVQG